MPTGDYETIELPSGLTPSQFRNLKKAIKSHLPGKCIIHNQPIDWNGLQLPRTPDVECDLLFFRRSKQLLCTAGFKDFLKIIIDSFLEAYNSPDAEISNAHVSTPSNLDYIGR